MFIGKAAPESAINRNRSFNFRKLEFFCLAICIALTLFVCLHFGASPGVATKLRLGQQRLGGCTSGSQNLDLGCQRDTNYNHAPPDDLIHIQYCTDDGGGFRPLLASMHSVLANTKHPERLRFHITIDPNTVEPFELCTTLLFGFQRQSSKYIGSLDTAGPWDSSTQFASCLDQDASSTATSCYCHSYQFHIIKFIASNYEISKANAMQKWAASIAGRTREDLLNTYMKFARNYADDYLLPLAIKKIIYLDIDTIVRDDLHQIWYSRLPKDKMITILYEYAPQGKPWFNFSSPIVQQRLRPGFIMNDGVYLLDLEKYKQFRIQEEISRLVEIHSRETLWYHGVQQPSFILATAPYTLRLPREWNLIGLGWERKPPDLLDVCSGEKVEEDNSYAEMFKTAKVLHWSGQMKPWNCRDDENCCQQHWLPYDLLK